MEICLEILKCLCVSNIFHTPDTFCVGSTTKSKSVCRSVPGGKTSLSYEFFCEGAGCEAGTKLFWFR